MRKKQSDYLDQEAMKQGYQKMLRELITQIEKGEHTEAMKAVFTENKRRIESRLKGLSEPKEAAQ